MELSTEDKQRIEQEANRHHGKGAWYEFYAFKKGAEYATIYERERQIKTLSRPGSKYYVSYDPDYKDKVFGVFNKEDLTQQGAEKMAQQLNNLEAKRTELRNKIQARHEVVNGLMQKMKSTLYWHERKEEKDFLTDLLNSLKK